ncbi:replicative DNA helicase [Micromonospora sp. NPDC005252]|uniref:replicative DNA helicase n=1 Tax=unclassified Micromonospora TaxID=2617518 RepID=UPI00368CDED0
MEGGPVSVTDDRRAESRPGGGQPPVQRDGQFDKTPPQDVAAEQCVLGGMLLSKDAIADVVEILKTNDFYRPVHATIFDIILDIYGRGEPADSITVAAALADSGDLVRVGGAPYLHTLIASVPTAANAAYYARIVSERAVLRRLVEAGTKIVQLGYGTASGGSRDVDDVVDLAQQAVYDVTERRVSEDFAVLADMLQPTLDEIEAVGAQGGMMTGVPTGFTDLDRLLNGLHAGQLIIVAGRPGLGKALALDTPLPTPDGWTTMGEVKVGDRLIGADGHPTTVTHAFEVRHDRPCYEVEFSDGSVLVADAEHLWKTTTRASRRAGDVRRRNHWRPETVERLRVAAATSTDTVTIHELASSVGAELVHTAQRVTRDIPRGASPTMRGRPGARPARAYPARALYGGLLNRVERWTASLADSVQPGVFTTAQIRATLRTETADRRLNHAVTNAAPLNLPDRLLPIPPYTLGAWLGDGSSADSRITTVDPGILRRIEEDGFEIRQSRSVSTLYTILPKSCPVCDRRRNGCVACGNRPSSLVRSLRESGVLNVKHIPEAYLRASEGQRRALLAGLLDTDGTVTGTGNVQFTSTSERLAADVYELIVSLGYRCSISLKAVEGRKPETSVAYNVNFTTTDEVFGLARKRDAHVARRRGEGPARTGCRFIVDVRPVPSVPVRCVTVDNDDHLYLAGRSMIPTHNSTASMDFARNAAIRANQAAAIFSLEMSKVEIVMRLLSAEARVPLHVLRSGQLSDDDWTKLARCMGEISEAPLFVDDTPSMNLMEIRAKARRLKQRHDLKMIVVDYLQLMTSPKRTESRQQEVADLSRGLKLLAKEVECPVIAVSQLNRGPEQRTDKRPQLSDLRESGSIEQDADVVILLHRDDYYDKESPRAGEADFIIAKHRNGPTDTVTVAAQLHLSRFVDMAIG